MSNPLLRQKRPIGTWIILIVIVLLALAPLGLSSFSVFLLSRILFMGLAAMSLYVLMGLGGMLSFAQMGFFGVTIALNTCVAVCSYFVYGYQMEPVIRFPELLY